ncbi:MAG: M23 family metallopeptidase [Candidatus Rokubacteria bacterium]|nr:M23 family metallopeptidase [Candidatus Rokubacteria bacterium]
MSHRRRAARFHVIVASGEGARLLRLAIPRWTLRASAAVASLAVAGLAVLLADYTVLRASRIETTAFEARIAEERDANARLRAEIDTIRREVDGWPALHAKIVSPFGRSAPTLAPAGGASDDADRTAVRVQRATGTLRQIAGVMLRFDRALSHMPTAWPVRAAINSEFGQRRSPWTGDAEYHRGVDIAASHGERVHAPAPGAIAFSGRDGGYGLSVVVDHGSNVKTRYGHLSRVSVKAGEQVARGQLLGRAGSTGRSTGAHLHYEVLVAGRPVNPRAYLWD